MLVVLVNVGNLFVVYQQNMIFLISNLNRLIEDLIIHNIIRCYYVDFKR